MSADSAAPPSIEDLYGQVRLVLGVQGAGAVGALVGVATGLRAISLATPTLPPATHTSAYLVGPAEGAGDLWIVDPATPYPDQQAVLLAALDAEAAAGRRLAAILLTHHHADHVGAAVVVAAHTGAPIAAHRATAERLARRGIKIDLILEDGAEIGPLTCVWTPGHAPGHLCFQDRATGGMIVGDMVAGIGTILIDPSDGDMTAYLASLARMRALGPTALYPAHGPTIVDAIAKLDEYVAHRQMREARIAAALPAEPASARALVAIAYADTPAMMWPLAERSLLAHLVKLERDQRARRVGEAWARA
jgi:glyoxylase-like metal-dependent hydrolase (beta-lactamase superfamily II)